MSPGWQFNNWHSKDIVSVFTRSPFFNLLTVAGCTPLRRSQYVELYPRDAKRENNLSYRIGIISLLFSPHYIMFVGSRKCTY